MGQKLERVCFLTAAEILLRFEIREHGRQTRLEGFHQQQQFSSPCKPCSVMLVPCKLLVLPAAPIRLQLPQLALSSEPSGVPLARFSLQNAATVAKNNPQ